MVTTRIKKTAVKDTLVVTLNINLTGGTPNVADAVVVPAPIQTLPLPVDPPSSPAPDMSIPEAPSTLPIDPPPVCVNERHSFWDKVDRFLSRIGLELVEDAHQGYKFASMWFFVALMAAPDLYNLAVSNNLITAAVTPPVITHAINLLAFMGAASRLIQSKKSAQN